jgi:hypothetical protein
MRALIRLAVLYGNDVELSGPLFLKIHKTGAVMQKEPVVSACIICVLPLDKPKNLDRLKVYSAMHLQLTCRILVTRHGHSMAHIPFAVEVVSIISRTVIGLYIWWLPGVADHSWRQSLCFATFTPPTTTMS